MYHLPRFLNNTEYNLNRSLKRIRQEEKTTIDNQTREKNILPSSNESNMTTMSFCRSRSSFSRPIWLESCDHKKDAQDLTVMTIDLVSFENITYIYRNTMVTGEMENTNVNSYHTKLYSNTNTCYDMRCTFKILCCIQSQSQQKRC